MAGKKISGADFKAFYTDPKVWDDNGKPGWYVDDFLIRVDGLEDVSMDVLHDRFGEALEKLPDDASIRIESGFLAWQGSGREPAGQETDLALRFKRWLDERTQATLVATIYVSRDDPREIERIRKILEDLGAAVVVSGDPDAPTAKPGTTPRP